MNATVERGASEQHARERAERVAAIRKQHQDQASAFAARAVNIDRHTVWLSIVRLALFVLAAAWLASFVRNHDNASAWLSALASGGFVAALVVHGRLLANKRAAESASGIHQRHFQRTTQAWTAFALPGQLVPEDHPYAWDIDLVGPGSLLQRMDVSHTVWGERALLDWLSAAAPTRDILERQAAVQELADASDFRRQFELSGLAEGLEKLSGERFLDFVQRRPLIGPALTGILYALPVVGVSVVTLVFSGVLPHAWLLALVPQALVVGQHWRAASQAFALLDTRRQHLEAFSGLLRTIEQHHFETPLLQRLKKRFEVAGKSPSAHMRTLANWSGWAELRFQVLFHPLLNVLLMWDLQVLLRMEAWTRVVGSRVRVWFETVGEIEALASLATLRSLEPGSVFPEIVEQDQGLTAVDIAQPLLPVEVRIGNDASIAGPGAFLILTGSNMAGKSTFLRTIGLNAALAFAGGPVCATAFSLPQARLRTSMRVRDSLQSGASYFYAEVMRIKGLASDAAAEPPILFLFDELLRGTNARERTLGARAIILHLVERRAWGVIATHDEALCDLCDEPGVSCRNVHFTDLMENGKMVFDFKLRPGRAAGGNALAILEQAGITSAPPPRAPRSAK